MGHKSFNGVQFGWDTYYFRAIAEYKTREHSNLIDKGGSGIEWYFQNRVAHFTF